MEQDNDLLICELQHENDNLKKENERLHEILALAKDPTHNPTFVANELMELPNNSYKKAKNAVREKLEMQLEWYNSFVDAIENWDYKIYNRACKYADEVEEGCI